MGKRYPSRNLHNLPGNYCYRVQLLPVIRDEAWYSDQWQVWFVTWAERLTYTTPHMRLSYNNHAEMQTSKISGNQVPEHRSTTRKSVAEQTAATMKRQHCTPAPRPREFKVHHIDGAGLQSPFIGAENRTVPFIGRDCTPPAMQHPRNPQRQGTREQTAPTTAAYKLPTPQQPSSITDT